MEIKYRIDDVVEVLFWEPSIDQWTQGVVHITGFMEYANDPTKRVVFDVKVLHTDKGWEPIRMTAVNAEHFQTKSYIKYIGNMNDNPALRTLYGSQEKQTDKLT